MNSDRGMPSLSSKEERFKSSGRCEWTRLVGRNNGIVRKRVAGEAVDVDRFIGLRSEHWHRDG